MAEPDADPTPFECEQTGALALFDDSWSRETDSLRDLMHRCAERWKLGADKRLLLKRELDRAKNGEPMRWSNIEEKDRLHQALTEHGYPEEAARLIRGEPIGGTLESIIHGDDIAGIEFFERGLVASRAVARVEVPLSMQQVSYGSGVLVSRRLFLTNNHVVDSANVAASTRVQFEYLTTAVGRHREPLEFAMEPDIFFVTSRALDYTLVALAEYNENGARLMDRGWCPLIAQSGKLIVGERTNIIQHPRGERMKVAVRANRLVCVVGDFLQYTADTEKGSSGAPVFNDLWQLAAIHHMGVPKLAPDGEAFQTEDGSAWDGSAETASRIVTVGNEGVRVSRIVADARAQLTDRRCSCNLPAHVPMAEETLLDETSDPPDAMNLWDLFTQTGTSLFPGASQPQQGGTTALSAAGGEVSVKIEAPNGVRTPFAVIVQIGEANWVAASGGGFAEAAGNILPAPALAGEPALDDEWEADEAAREAAWDDLEAMTDPPGRPLARALRRLIERAATPRRIPLEDACQRLYASIDRARDGTIRDPLSGERRNPAVLAAADDPATRDPALWVLPVLDRAPDGQDGLHDLHELFALTRPRPVRALLTGGDPWILPDTLATPVRCGALARAAFYALLRSGGGGLDAPTRALLLSWHEADPVDDWERRRNARIAGGSEARNPFIDRPEIATAEFLRIALGG